MQRALSADVGLGRPQRLPVEVQRQVVAEGHQPPGPPGRLGVLAQALLLLGPLDLLDVRQQVVERAELLEEGRRESRADAGDARDVVDGVAGEGEEVDDLVGADAPVLLERRRVDHRVLAQVEDPDVVGSELPRVLVGRADEDVEPALFAAPGQGGDDVVGLHSRLDQDGDLEPLEDAADHGDLRDQVGGHLRPVGLVLGDRSPSGRPARRRRRPPPGSRACGRAAG